MKKFFSKTTSLFSMLIVVVLTSLVSAKPISNNSFRVHDYAKQGPDFNARLQAVEQRITTLKQMVTTKPQFKKHRGALSSIENKKNTLKADVKAHKDQAQIENSLKALEEKVSALESQVK